MSNIKICDLQLTQIQFTELSDLELELVIGGGWFKKLTGISTPKFIKKIDQTVRQNIPGGWITVGQKLLGF